MSFSFILHSNTADTSRSCVSHSVAVKSTTPHRETTSYIIKTQKQLIPKHHKQPNLPTSGYFARLLSYSEYPTSAFLTNNRYTTLTHLIAWIRASPNSVQPAPYSHPFPLRATETTGAALTRGVTAMRRVFRPAAVDDTTNALLKCAAQLVPCVTVVTCRHPTHSYCSIRNTHAHRLRACVYLITWSSLSKLYGAPTCVQHGCVCFRCRITFLCMLWKSWFSAELQRTHRHYRWIKIPAINLFSSARSVRSMCVYTHNYK